MSSHIQSIAAATANAASTAAIAATSGRSGPTRPRRASAAHEPGAERDHEQEESDHAQLRQRLEPERVRIAHEQRSEACSIHQDWYEPAPPNAGLVSHSSTADVHSCQRPLPVELIRCDRVKSPSTQAHVGPRRAS